MLSTSFIAPLLLLASLSSALPAPIATPMDIDERSGSWKVALFDSIGLNPSSRIVLNATLQARGQPRAPRVIANPKWRTYRPTPAATSSAVVVAPDTVEPTSETVPSTTATPVIVPTTSAAPKPTSTSTSTQAPKPTVVPFKGQATYFFQNGNPGACGVYNSDSTPLVALDWRLYGDMSKQSQYCGRKLTITNTDNGKSVVAIAQDACPSCESKYSLDLSTGAFDAIGERDTGVLPISWVWND